MNFKGARMPSAPAGASALSKLGLLAGAALYLGNKALYNVEGGHRAIVFNRLEGIKDKVYPEGTHIVIPWFERPIIYDVRARPNLLHSISGSRDLQMVRIDLCVLARPLPERLPSMHRALGESYNDTLLPSIIRDTVGAVVAQYNASQLITEREAVSREIRKTLTDRAMTFNIALDDVSLTSLCFDMELAHALEGKQIATQEAERAKFIVEKAEQEKKSAVIRAQWHESITIRTFGTEAKLVTAQEAECAKFIVEKAEQDKKSAIIRAQGEVKPAEPIGQSTTGSQGIPMSGSHHLLPSPARPPHLSLMGGRGKQFRTAFKSKNNRRCAVGRDGIDPVMEAELHEIAAEQKLLDLEREAAEAEAAQAAAAEAASAAERAAQAQAAEAEGAQAATAAQAQAAEAEAAQAAAPPA